MIVRAQCVNYAGILPKTVPVPGAGGVCRGQEVGCNPVENAYLVEVRLNSPSTIKTQRKTNETVPRTQERLETF